MKTDLVALVDISDKEAFIKNGYLDSGTVVSFGKKTIVINLQFTGSEGNIETYSLPFGLMNMADIYINGFEYGCAGTATVVSHVDGSILRPFRIIKSTATAIFAAACFVTTTVVKKTNNSGMSIKIVRHNIFDISNNYNIKYKKDILFAGSVEEFNRSEESLLYDGAVKAATKRSSLRTNPDSPCYAL